MECVVKYKPIIWKTSPEDSAALKDAYLSGDGLCPACKRQGLRIPIEERFGESPWESDGTYAVCVENKHAAPLD